MNISKGHTGILIILVLVVFTCCKRVIVQVDSIPSNTPKNQALFITGNFNNWDPGDQRYMMQLGPDSVYSIELPQGFGAVEYKFTRGDWTTVEKDICGYEINNRTFIISEHDTVRNQIDSWNDLDPLNCPRVTIVLKELPEDTPINDDIYLIGNMNSWNADNAVPVLMDSRGIYSITIDRPPDINTLEFKITRGDLTNSESDEFGNSVPNRVLPFGIKDTVELNVGGWIDRAQTKGSNRVIFMISGLPKETPAFDEIYLASSFNNWMPGDRNYVFQKDRNGNYIYPFPRKKGNVEFKITRGSWLTREVDKFGYEIPNRYVDLLASDTVYIDVQAWKDRIKINDNELTIIIDKLPVTTPDNPDLFLAGDINGWEADKSKFRFEKFNGGNYYLNVERKRQSLEFKITRGSWDKVEVDEFGLGVENRIVYYKDFDTIYIQIENWLDKPTMPTESVTLVIDHLPENTPRLDDIYLAPDFNGWNPMDKNLIFKKLPDNRFYITIPAKGGKTEYKITRGGWSKVEVDEYGRETQNRTLVFGFSDTIHISVAKWRDFDGDY